MSEQPKSGQGSSPPKRRGYIFISYRRDDTAGFAGRLYDRLSTHFPKHGIFMDVDSISPGTDFIEAMKESVAASGGADRIDRQTLGNLLRRGWHPSA